MVLLFAIKIFFHFFRSEVWMTIRKLGGTVNVGLAPVSSSWTWPWDEPECPRISYLALEGRAGVQTWLGVARVLAGAGRRRRRRWSAWPRWPGRARGWPGPSPTPTPTSQGGESRVEVTVYNSIFLKWQRGFNSEHWGWYLGHERRQVVRWKLLGISGK